MARWVLFLVSLVAWAALVPAGWWLCHQKCEPAAQHSSDPLRGNAVLASLAAAAAVGKSSAVWAGPLLEAVHEGARDALGSTDAADKALAGAGLPQGLAAEVRALVAARLRDAHGDSSLAKAKTGASPKGVYQARLREAQSDSSPAKAETAGSPKGSCPGGRPAVAIPPLQQLALPVLDSLDGRVSPAGKVAPNMPANAWGVPMPNITVEVSPGKILTVDEVVYGYDLVFEAMHLFSYVSWGRVPMQQDPADALAIADLISRLQPDCFVELGTNTGGGAVFYAEVMKQYQAKPLVVTIDVHEPALNWDKFANKVCPHCVPVSCHPAWQEEGLIEFIKGFTQEDSVVAQVDRLLNERQCKRTVVMHDSDHRGFAVERDLQIYHRFVPVGSYLIVQDTKLSRMRGGRYQTLQAARGFLETPAGKGKFVVDRTFEYQLFSHHHSGFMQRISA